MIRQQPPKPVQPSQQTQASSQHQVPNQEARARMFSGPQLTMMDKAFDRDNWYKNLKKHPLTPPNWVFTIVWVILYTLIGAAYIIYKQTTGWQTTTFTVPFHFHLALNFAWWPMFFLGRMTTIALFSAVALQIFLVISILLFYDKCPLAAYLLIPQALWIVIAIYLNYYIFKHNPDPYFVILHQKIRRQEQMYERIKQYKKKIREQKKARGQPLTHDEQQQEEKLKQDDQEEDQDYVDQRYRTKTQ